jgi:hypothetical protein
VAKALEKAPLYGTAEAVPCPTAADLNSSIENAPLISAHRLGKIFGNAEGEITLDKVRVKMQTRSLAVF